MLSSSYSGIAALERDDVHDAGALEDRQRIGGIEAREAVTREERPVDLFLAVLPAAPFRNGRQEGVDTFALELLAHGLLVARPRPDGEPLSSLNGPWLVAGGW